MSKMSTYIKASRPISWLNTAYPFAAAYLLVTHHVSLELVIGSIYFLIPYNFLLYGINDVFDYESDLLNARKGGIEGAVVERSYHKSLLWAVAITNLPFLIYFVLIGSFTAKLTFVTVIFLALAYSLPKLRFKERPFVDSLTSSLHFVGPMIYALVLTGWHAHYLPYTFAFILWGMASHAFGAVQDIIPDRQAHIASVATVLGARSTVRFAVACYAACALLLAMTGVAGLIAGLVTLIYIANIYRYHSVSDIDSTSTNKAWRKFIYLNLFAGFIITQLIIWHMIKG